MGRSTHGRGVALRSGVVTAAHPVGVLRKFYQAHPYCFLGNIHLKL